MAPRSSQDFACCWRVASLKGRLRFKTQ